MVLGASSMVTAIPSVSQCADIARMALGQGNSSGNAAHARLQELSSMAFIGEPWPMNRAGIRSKRGSYQYTSVLQIGRSRWGSRSARAVRELAGRRSGRVQADVEHRCRVGERADADQVDAGLRDGPDGREV